MIRSRLLELRRKKSYEENRPITLRIVAQETGLATGTVQRISNGAMEGVRISTLDTLCEYFGVGSISELIEFSPTPIAEQRASARQRNKP